MLEPEVEAKIINLRRGTSLRIPLMSGSSKENESGLCRSGSLKISRITNDDDDHVQERARLTIVKLSPSSTSSSSSSSSSVASSDRCASCGTNNKCFAKLYASANDAPAPEYLARSLLQLGCPAVSMPTPRSGIGSEQPPSSDSDDYTSTHHQGAGGYGQNLDVHTVPKVQVSGPSNADESASVINGSAGSIGARSAPSTPLQVVSDASQTAGQPSSTISSGPQLTVAGTSSHPQPPRSPSHAALRCNDSQLSKPLSRSTPSMAAGGAQTPATVSRSSSRSSPTSTSSARQKKFHRHFSQVAADEHVLNYYSCALVGDILLQGHLYITPNYFAFYSNVFGYVTKLLIPTVSVLKISKEKTARIIPNAVAVATEEERHVFCSLLSRDSTYKLMKQVWDAALEPRSATTSNVLPALDNDNNKLIAPEALLVDDSEVNAGEDESSMSESGTDITATTSSRPPTTCIDTSDVASVALSRPSLPSARLETMVLTVPNKSGRLKFFFANGLKPGMVITILVVLLAILYVSAALMMMRIDRLHTAYLNHPLVSPERFTQDRLLYHLNMNLDQIVKVRQSLQALLQQLLMISQSGSETGSASGVVDPKDAPS